MSNRTLQKLERLIKLQKEMQPRTIYEELATDGLLHDYLKIFMSDKIQVDEDFRDSMFDLIYAYSEIPIPELEVFILEKMCEALGYFQEYTRLCQIQKH